MFVCVCVHALALCALRGDECECGLDLRAVSGGAEWENWVFGGWRGGQGRKEVSRLLGRGGRTVEGPGNHPWDWGAMGVCG